MAMWIDKNRVLEHKGKTIKCGQQVPSDLPKESYDKFVKAGSIGNSLPTVPEQKNLVTELKSRLEDVVKQNTGLTDANTELTAARNELTAANTELTASLENAEKQIATLTEQIMKPATDAAGPAKGKK